MKGIIYKIVNGAGEIIYIGASTLSLEDVEKQQRLRASSRKTTLYCYLADHIPLGESFYWVLISTAPYKALLPRKKKLVEKYAPICNIYLANKQCTQDLRQQRINNNAESAREVFLEKMKDFPGNIITFQQLKDMNYVGSYIAAALKYKFLTRIDRGVYTINIRKE